MTNKDFLKAVSTRADLSTKETQQLIEQLVEVMADSLDEGDSVSIQGYGSYEVKKKMERIIVNPATKQRQLIPPKLAVAFKPSNVLKDKIKDL